MTREEIVNEIRNSALRDVADKIVECIAPSIRMHTRRVESDDLPIGASRMGGMPDWPASTPWPKVNDLPLAFIAQISMADIRRIDETWAGRGWLYFFYDTQSQPWGYDPKDKGKSRVIHVHCPLDDLDRVEPPAELPEESKFELCALVTELEYTIPPEWALPVILDRDSTQAEKTAYEELTDKLYDELTKYHRMFGFEDAIQGDMRLECQLVSNGLYCGDQSGYEDPRATQLEERDDKWLLLLQVDSDEEGPGWMWDDAGRIYYWIKEADLEREAYDQSWMILQCY